MAVLAADKNVSSIGASTITGFAVNVADTYYRGAIVYVDTGGGSQVVPVAGDRCLGISPKKQVLATTDLAEVLVSGVIWLPVGTAVEAEDEGDLLILDISATQSDNPSDLVSAGDTTLGADDVAVGTILKVTATQMLVRIGDFTGRLYDATAAAWV